MNAYDITFESGVCELTITRKFGHKKNYTWRNSLWIIYIILTEQQRQFGGRPQFGGGRPTFGRPPFGGGRPTFGGGRPPFFGVLSNGTNPFANLTTSSVNVTVPSDIAQLLANLFGSGNIGFQFGEYYHLLPF